MTKSSGPSKIEAPLEERLEKRDVPHRERPDRATIQAWKDGRGLPRVRKTTDPSEDRWSALLFDLAAVINELSPGSRPAVSPDHLWQAAASSWMESNAPPRVRAHFWRAAGGSFAAALHAACDGLSEQDRRAIVDAVPGCSPPLLDAWLSGEVLPADRAEVMALASAVARQKREAPDISGSLWRCVVEDWSMTLPSEVQADLLEQRGGHTRIDVVDTALRGHPDAEALAGRFAAALLLLGPERVPAIVGLLARVAHAFQFTDPGGAYSGLSALLERWAAEAEWYRDELEKAEDRALRRMEEDMLADGPTYSDLRTPDEEP